MTGFSASAAAARVAPPLELDEESVTSEERTEKSDVTVGAGTSSGAAMGPAMDGAALGRTLGCHVEKRRSLGRLTGQPIGGDAAEVRTSAVV